MNTSVPGGHLPGTVGGVPAATTKGARPLGTTGMVLSLVGLGTWAIGGPRWRYGWGKQSDHDSIATVRGAAEAGFNWLDTAAVYGLGHAETTIGRALAGLPAEDRPFVSTKCGLVWDRHDPYAPPRRRMAPASVRRELDDSLRRLRLERIDLYQVHQPDDGHEDLWESVRRQPTPEATPLEEYWQVMADLKREGKVRAIGLSNHSVDELTRAEAIAHVDVIQPMFSAIARESASQIAWAAARGVGVLVYQPMHSGLLSGAFSAARVAALPRDDWRRTDPAFTTALADNLAVAAAMREIAAARGVPTAAVAIAWALSWPGVTAAIVGARRPSQLADFLPVATLTLTDAELAVVAAAAAAGGHAPAAALPEVADRWRDSIMKTAEHQG